MVIKKMFYSWKIDDETAAENYFVGFTSNAVHEWRQVRFFKASLSGRLELNIVHNGNNKLF